MRASILTQGMIISDRYVVGAPIGAGSFGEVVAAYDRRLDSDVALKVLHQEALENDPRALVRMRQEAEILRRIQHPNIVKIFDIGSFNGSEFLSMELIAGASLRDILDEESILPTPRLLSLIRQLLSALAAIHSASILHRDLKPENLLVIPDGAREMIKLVDFGIAKANHSLNSDDPDGGITLVKTRVGSFVGTPRYAAPEMVVGDPPEAPADLFCVGLIAYEALAGESLIKARTHSELMNELVFPRPFDLSALPEDWRSWLKELLEKSPARRPQSAQEALELLNQLFPLSQYPEPSPPSEREEELFDPNLATDAWQRIDLDYEALEENRSKTRQGHPIPPQESRPKRAPGFSSPSPRSRESIGNLLFYFVVGAVGLLILAMLYLVFSGRLAG